MQIVFIGAALLVLAVLAYLGITAAGNWLLKKWDTHEIVSHARKVEREHARKEAAFRSEMAQKEEAMRRYAMDSLRPARKL